MPDPAYEGRSPAIHVDLETTTPTIVPAEPEYGAAVLRGRSRAIRTIAEAPSWDLSEVTGPRHEGPHYVGRSPAIHVRGSSSPGPVPPPSIRSCRCCAEAANDCGRTDAFDRIETATLGVSDAGPAWTKTGGAPNPNVIGGAAILVADGGFVDSIISEGFVASGSLGMSLPWDASNVKTLRFQLVNMATPSDDFLELRFACTNFTPSSLTPKLIISDTNPAASYIRMTSGPTDGTLIPTSFWNASSTYVLTVYTSGSTTVASVTDGASTYSTSYGQRPKFATVSLSWHLVQVFPFTPSNRTVRVLDVDVPEFTRCSMSAFESFQRETIHAWDGGTWFATGFTPAHAFVEPGYGEFVVPAGDHDVATTLDDAGDWTSPSGFTMTCLVWSDVVPGAGESASFEFADDDFNFDLYLNMSTDPAQGGVQIFSSGSGSAAKTDWVAETWYAVKLEYVPGDTARAKVWEYGTAEPVAWDASTGAGSAPTSYFDFLAYNYAGVDVDFRLALLDFSVGASLVAAVSPGELPSIQSYTELPTDGTTIPALPAYLVPFTDPVTGATVVRVSNVPGRRHAYARFSAWNCTGTRLLLGFAFPGRMLDGASYVDLGSFSQISNAIWSNVNPNVLYGVSGNTLVRQDATTGSIVAGDGGLVHAFAGYTSVQIGGDSTGSANEGGISDDDRYICLTGYGAGSAHLIVYDLQTGGIADVVAPAGLDNAQISRHGNYVVVVGSFGTRRYPRNLTGFVTLDPYGNHGDNALDATGREVYVTNNGPYVVSYDLAAGTSTQLMGGSPATAFEYGHTSGRAINRNGWVYLSSYDYTSVAGRRGRDQIVAVATDGSGTINGFGFANVHYDGDLNYSAQPHACPSPDGSRVVFASAWGTDASGDVYAYVSGAAATVTGSSSAGTTGDCGNVVAVGRWEEFNRTAVNGWDGGWTIGSDGGAPPNLLVDGQRGIIHHSGGGTVSVDRTAPVTTAVKFTMTARVRLDAGALSNAMLMSLAVIEGAEDFQVLLATARGRFVIITPSTDERVLPIPGVAFAYSAGVDYIVKAEYDYHGSGLARAKIWVDGATEPGWLISQVVTATALDIPNGIFGIDAPSGAVHHVEVSVSGSVSANAAFRLDWIDFDDGCARSVADLGPLTGIARAYVPATSVILNGLDQTVFPPRPPVIRNGGFGTTGSGKEDVFFLNFPPDVASAHLTITVKITLGSFFGPSHPRCFFARSIDWELVRAVWPGGATPVLAYDDLQLGVRGSVLTSGTFTPPGGICYPVLSGDVNPVRTLGVYEGDFVPDGDGRVQLQVHIADLWTEAAYIFNNTFYGSGLGSFADLDMDLYTHALISYDVVVRDYRSSDPDCAGGAGCAECEDPDNPGFNLPDFTPGFMPHFRRQIGDPTTTLDGHICTLESAAMVLEWHTRGAVAVWGGELIPYCGKTEAQILATGSNLSNAEQAWAHYGQSLSVRSGQTFDDLLACLAEGRAAIVQGDYSVLTNAEKCQDSFDGFHAISAYPYMVSDRVLVGDPLCSTFTGLRVASLRAYAEGLGVAAFGVTSPQQILFAVSRSSPV